MVWVLNFAVLLSRKHVFNPSLLVVSILCHAGGGDGGEGIKMVALVDLERDRDGLWPVPPAL